jgi:four helix bundle protein
VGANYRASQRAKSTADFINKLKIVEEEADESMYFLELLMEVLNDNKEELKTLHKEANDIVSIVVASINKARQHK